MAWITVIRRQPQTTRVQRLHPRTCENILIKRILCSVKSEKKNPECIAMSVDYRGDNNCSDND